MLDVNNLEIGKVYLLELKNGERWLFEKARPRIIPDAITSCGYCMCLDGFTDIYGGVVCGNDRIKQIRNANANYIAMWNRTFPDNIKCL